MVDSVLLDDTGMWVNWVGFDVTMNDAWDGEARIQLYADSGSGFEPTGDAGSADYTSGSAGEGGSWRDEVTYRISGAAAAYTKRPGKFVVTYKLKDGTEGTAESNTFTMYAGNYVRDRSVSYDGRTVTIDLELDPSAVTAADVELEYSSFAHGGTLAELSSSYTEGNHIYLKYQIGSGHAGETYNAFAALIYSEGSGSNWSSFNEMAGTLQVN